MEEPNRDSWGLRPATLDDVDGLHALACEPLVYRYLYDGAAPDRELIARIVARAAEDAAGTGLGLWILEGEGVRHGGCVQLQPGDMGPRCATLAYLLDPAHWRRGLATSMAWTAITRAFQTGIDMVVAGTDAPNTASLAVMRRLGMRFLRDVSFPLGPGVEYVLSRGDPGPEPSPALLPMG
jgi:RimJ/RimL family protein N-acetyltransferase